MCVMTDVCFRNSFLCGAVFTSCIIQIPLRFQAVNHESPWHAGVRLIPFGMAVPVGAFLTAAICGKRRMPIIYMLFVASLLQALGLAFMSRLTLERVMWKGQYGLQFVTGLGCGMSIGVVTLMTPFVIEKRDLGEALLLPILAVSNAYTSDFNFSSCSDPNAQRSPRPSYHHCGDEQ